MSLPLNLPCKAMLLAAGLGERLRPLTNQIPKPLIEVAGQPLILYNLLLLKKAGVKEVVINLHHLGNQIQSRLGDGSRYGLKIHYSNESEILGTGGGVKAAEKFLKNESFYLLNADVMIDLDLIKLWKFHQSHPALATLVVAPEFREDITRWVYVDPDQRIQAIAAHPPSIASCEKTIFTGVQILEPALFDVLPFHKKACLVQDGYLPLLEKGRRLNGWIHQDYWRDVGTLERYEGVKNEFQNHWPLKALSPKDFGPS